MSKTATGFRPPHCFAPVVGGGGYLLTGLGGVNRPFRAFATFPRSLGFGRKNHRGLPRGLPRWSVAIRLRLGKILISNRTSSAFWRRCPNRF